MFNMKNTFEHDGISSRGHGIQAVDKYEPSYGPSYGNGTIKRFFNIDKQLGKGAYSTVFRAINKHNNQPVALKNLQKFNSNYGQRKFRYDDDGNIHIETYKTQKYCSIFSVNEVHQ